MELFEPFMNYGIPLLFEPFMNYGFFKTTGINVRILDCWEFTFYQPRKLSICYYIYDAIPFLN